MFGKKTKIENLVLANGRVLVEKTEHRQIYKVLKVAKNVNYNSLNKKIEVGDLVVSSEWLHSSNFKLGSKDYYIIKPNLINGYFK